MKVERAFEILKSSDWEVLYWYPKPGEDGICSHPRPHVADVRAEADAYVIAFVVPSSEDEVRHYRVVDGQRYDESAVSSPSYRFPKDLVVEATSSTGTKLNRIVIRDAAGREVMSAFRVQGGGHRCMCGAATCGMQHQQRPPRPKTNLGDKLVESQGRKR